MSTRCKLLLLIVFSSLNSCGTMDPGFPGRCTLGTDSGYVASAQDTKGEPWTLEVSPASHNVLCAEVGTNGVLQFITVVRDAQNLPVSSVSVGATVPSQTGLRLVTAETLQQERENFKNNSEIDQTLVPSDTATDNCGVAVFTIVYTCPATAGLNVGGEFVAFSGSLFSNPAMVNVELMDPDEAAQ